MEMTIADNLATVFLEGSISEEDADRIKEMLIQHITNEEMIYHMDFSSVNNISCDGIGVLSIMQKMAVNKFGRFIIKGLTGEVKNRFEILQIDKYFEI